MRFLYQGLEHIPSSTKEQLEKLDEIIDSNFDLASKLLNKLKQNSKIVNDTHLALIIGIYEAYLLNKNTKYEQCLVLVERLLPEAIRTKKKETIYFLEYCKATALGFTQRFDEALSLIQSAIKNTQGSDPDLKAHLHYRLGYLMYYSRNFKESIESFLRRFTIQKKPIIYSS